jgi:hypothetical protein
VPLFRLDWPSFNLPFLTTYTIIYENKNILLWSRSPVQRTPSIPYPIHHPIQRILETRNSELDLKSVTHFILLITIIHYHPHP